MDYGKHDVFGPRCNLSIRFGFAVCPRSRKLKNRSVWFARTMLAILFLVFTVLFPGVVMYFYALRDRSLIDSLAFGVVALGFTAAVVTALLLVGTRGSRG